MEQGLKVLFDEKEMLIGVLKNDPKIMSHVWGQEIYRLYAVEKDPERAQDRLDGILSELADRYPQDPATLSRILRTMIIDYEIANIGVARLKSFERVHALVAGYVERNHAVIGKYE